MKQILKSRWLDILWLVTITIYMLAGIKGVPLHGDESTQIYMGRDFYYHIQGDTDRVLFREWDSLTGDESTEQQLRMLNGTLPKYLFGAVAYGSGYALEDINQQWAWGSGWDWNHENGHVPSDDLLFRSRFVSGVLLVISAIALFYAGNAIGGRAVAYLASAYYVLNPAILINGRRAMMEGGMLAFTILAILATLYLLKYRSWWLFMLTGIVSGLALASKHTSVVTIMVIFAVCGVYFLLKQDKRGRNIAGLFAAGLISLSVFFALNPAWWTNPVGTVETVLELRQELLAGQVGFYGGYDTFGQQFQGFARQSFVVLPMYAESDTDSFYSQQIEEIEQYDSSLLSGVSIGGSTIGAVIVFLLCSIGLVRLWLCEMIEKSSAWLISAWLIAMILLTLFLTPLEWQRYYLPIYPVLAILLAGGLNYSLVTVTQWQKKTQQK